MRARRILNATRRFAYWCEARGIDWLVQPFHVAAFIKEFQGNSHHPQ
jgi:hypothetical protein